MARSITGTVTSDKGDKTIVITVTAHRTHPLYKKQYTQSRKFMAHDEKNDAKVGDLVLISESRPLSANKRFTLIRILERSGVRFEEADATADVPEEQLAAAEISPKEADEPVKSDEKPEKKS